MAVRFWDERVWNATEKSGNHSSRWSLVGFVAAIRRRDFDGVSIEAVRPPRLASSAPDFQIPCCAIGHEEVVRVPASLLTRNSGMNATASMLQMWRILLYLFLQDAWELQLPILQFSYQKLFFLSLVLHMLELFIAGRKEAEYQIDQVSLFVGSHSSKYSRYKLPAPEKAITRFWKAPQCHTTAPFWWWKLLRKFPPLQKKHRQLMVNTRSYLCFLNLLMIK